MITLRFEDNIFTAANIEMISPLDESIPSINKYSIYSVKDNIIKKTDGNRAPWVEFSIRLVSGKVLESFSNMNVYQMMSSS